MKFETIKAPHINANDLEMVIVEWFVEPMDHVKKGDTICEVETTKSVFSVETEFEGFINPKVVQGETVKVGEPIAHICQDKDFSFLNKINVSESNSTVVSKKAKTLMDQFKLNISDFPNYTSISSDTVIAKIREIEKEVKERSKEDIEKIINTIDIKENSVGICGEDENKALLALDCFESNQEYDVVVYLNDFHNNEQFYGIPTLSIKELELLHEKGLKYIYICGNSLEFQQKMYEICKKIGIDPISVIHSSATVSSYSNLGKSVYIGPNVIVGPDTEIGDFSVLLNASTVAHHTKLGKYVTLSDGTHIAGNVTIGDLSYLGIGVIVNKRINIGKKVVVVSGAIVIDNVADDSIVRLN